MNLYHKKSQYGATTLVISTLLIIAATLIVIFAASYSVMQQKITDNQYTNQQAYQAAQAGMEFGINYLLQNNATIIAGPVGGFIKNYTSTSTTNVALPNNSKFSITYSNPVANNYTLIQITATGTSADGSSTRTVRQQVQYGSVLFAPSDYALLALGNFIWTGNGTITNNTYNASVGLSGTMTWAGSTAKTVINNVTSSTPTSMHSDVSQNTSQLQGMSVATLFSEYFGATEATIKSQVPIANQHSCSGAACNNTNYSSTLNGVTGTTIWIDQPSGTATLGNVTIGSAANPVLLIVNGNLNITTNTTINGFLFVVGTTTSTTGINGNFTLNGAMAVGDSLTVNSGAFLLTYNPSILSTLKIFNQGGSTYYAKVPGSWRDF